MSKPAEYTIRLSGLELAVIHEAVRWRKNSLSEALLERHLPRAETELRSKRTMLERLDAYLLRHLSEKTEKKQKSSE